MKITTIESEKNWENRERCESPTGSTGTHYFPGAKRQCARHAVFEVDGKRLCKQHAGELALLYLLSQQETQVVGGTG